MPVVMINMLCGRDKDTKKLLLKNMTAAVTATLGVAPESVRVIINELPADHYGVAGLPILEYRSHPNGETNEQKK
jgi:4-oxalocrotonate tautomerase